MGISFVQVAQRDMWEESEWRIWRLCHNYRVVLVYLENWALTYVLANESDLGISCEQILYLLCLTDEKAIRGWSNKFQNITTEQPINFHHSKVCDLGYSILLW